MKYIGAHVSASGGVEVAPRNAQEIGANAFALFVKNQRQWTAAPLSPKSIDLFKQYCDEAEIAPQFILPHDSYLINMGSPKEEMREKSIKSFTDELLRCHQLGLRLLNFHPGSHLKEISEEECLRLIADGVNRAHREVPEVTTLIENVAGQGTNVGYNWEQIAFLIDLIEDKSRIGVCLDTAHTLAAGYEIRTADGYKTTMESFDAIIGKEYFRAVHLNDSKKELGSRVDRHESIGLGVMGNELFELLINDPRTNEIPIILETPNPDLWKIEIEQLRKLEKSVK